MNSKWSVLFCLCSVIFVAVRSFEENSLDPKKLTHYTWKLSESCNQLGLNVLSEIAKQTSKNVIFSPISIATTFGLIYLGARGSTAKELETVLGYKSLNLTRPVVAKAFQDILSNNLITVEHRAYVLDIATALFVSDSFDLDANFKSEAQEYFRAPVEVVNFEEDGAQAVHKINDFVRNKTRGKICSIVEHLDNSADIVAVNALYFKSRWTYAFSEANTKTGTFYNKGLIPTYVPMMQREDYYIYYSDDELSLVNLGFWGRNMSIFILLPHKMDGLHDLEKNLTHANINRYLMSSYPKPLKLILPKFNLSYSADLGPIFQAMGVRELFQLKSANLAGMVSGDEIAMGGVRHKAVIDVNENGVEASGVTAVLSFKSMPLPGGFADTFNVNHPFLFFILDERTDLIILMGRVWTL